jgi:hypothetical protein
MMQPADENARGLVERTMTDTGRLLWRDDVESVCPTIDSCFEYGGTVRCGPCAINAAILAGIEPNYSLPALPEVSRLTRENERLQAAMDDARAALEPFSEALGNLAGPDKNRWPDDETIDGTGAPEWITWGHLRAAATAIRNLR